MNNLLRHIPLFLVAVGLTLLCACVPTQGIMVSPLPVWQAPASTATHVDQFDVVDAVARYASKARVDTSDSQFTVVHHEWAMQLVSWSFNFAGAMSSRTDTGRLYAPETFDCDKFAKAFSLAAELSAGRKLSGAQVLVGRIYVQQINAFGGVPAGGNHALNFFVSEKGVYIVEPQTGRVSPLSEYPNRSTIYSVKIGG